jgi:dipeptidyl aminopeptidase/acylaminoacyl peptidase
MVVSVFRLPSSVFRLPELSDAIFMPSLVQKCLIPLVILAWSTASAEDVEPSLEQIFRPPRLLGVRPDGARISADGRYVTYRWTEKDALSPKRAVWLSRSDGRSARELFDDAAKVRLWWTPHGSQLLVHRRGWLELRDLASEEPTRPLFKVTGGISSLEFLEKGSSIVFVAGKPSRLWRLDLDTGERVDLSDGLENLSRRVETLGDGDTFAVFAKPSKKDAEAKEKTEPKPRVLYVVSEGAARETGFQEGGHVEVSPDAEWVVRSCVTRESSRELILADYLTDNVSTVRVRDSLAGDLASRVALTLYDVERAEDWSPEIDTSDRYQVRGLHWSPDSELLLHGMKDSNVFAQDTVRLMEKLIRLGKNFDAMLYPSQNHTFTDPAAWIDEYGRIERFFDRHLDPTATSRPRTF